MDNILPILQIINELKDSKNKCADFIDKISEVNDNGEQKLPLYYKMDDELILVYSDDSENAITDDFCKQLDFHTRCVILEKKTLKPILSQYNKFIYNDDALLKINNWDNVVVQKCYEGTLISVFFHKKWYISTRRCLDSKNSLWKKSKSYYEMFEDCIEGKFELDDLNKDYVYTFVLVHNQNLNIINYSSFMGESYKNIYHTMTTRKDNFLEVDYTINNNVNKPEEFHFEDVNSMLVNLHNESYSEQESRRIQTEGYIIKQYHGEKNKSYFTLLKIQTQLYQQLFKLKPNNSNLNQCYLELYQKDLLQEYLPYVTNYHFDIIKRINNSMRTLSKEILTIYHCTRKKKNPKLYEHLRDNYKKVIYELHGFYIENRKREFNIDSNSNNVQQKFKAITIHNVYHHIKSLDSKSLIFLYYERLLMMNDYIFEKYLMTDCIYTKTQTLLMFDKKELYKLNSKSKSKSKS